MSQSVNHAFACFLLVLYAGGSDDTVAVRTLTSYIRIVTITSVLVGRQINGLATFWASASVDSLYRVTATDARSRQQSTGNQEMRTSI